MGTPPPDKERLSERDFIQDKNPYPIWIWLFLMVVVAGLFWQIGSIYWGGGLKEEIQQDPFYQVTNRQMSLFLWQNPQYMRANAVEKGGYLPGFDTIDQIALDINSADMYAIAPPELFFLYHVWDRLVRTEFSNTPISTAEFRQFLSFAKEWLPRNWPESPPAYRQLIMELPQHSDQNLSDLSFAALPLEVRMAFQGWKNVFIQLEQIQAIKPTNAVMRQFLRTHPNYARNYWRNIVETNVPKYLYALTYEQPSQDDTIPENQLTPFLKQAFFNFTLTQPSQIPLQ